VAALRGRRNYRITAVADPEPERREQAVRELGCRAFADYREMLKHADAELVCIATRNRDHAPHALAALASGRHVVVEKPMAMNLRQADRMIAASRRRRRKLFVHQNYRFKPEFLHLREVCRSGIIGRVFHIRGYWLSFARRNDWQTLRKYGGGVLNNTCPHIIDMALQLIGWPVTRVFGDLQHINDAGDVEDHVKIVLRGRSGCTADLEVSTACAFPAPRWTLLGEHGTMITDGQTSKITYYDPKKVKKLRVIETTPAGRRYGNEDVLPWQEKEVPVRAKPVGDFYDNVYGVLRKRQAMVVTPESVREVMRVIALVRRGTAFPG